MRVGRFLGCHQMYDRSFFIKGYQFPVCARCTGVIVAQILTIIAIIVGFRISSLYSILLLIPMAIDWSLQYFQVLISTNIRRLISGLLAGIGLTYIYFYIIIFIYNKLF